MERSEQAERDVLAACQITMGRGIEIVSRAWSVEFKRGEGTYQHKELKLCPLSAVLIINHVPCVDGPMYDAARALGVSVGWVIGFCRGFDEGKQSHPTDGQWFKATVCCPMDLGSGRRAGFLLRRQMETPGAIQEMVKSEQNRGPRRAAVRRTA